MCPDTVTTFLEAFGWGSGCGFVLALVMIYAIFKQPRAPRG